MRKFVLLFSFILSSFVFAQISQPEIYHDGHGGFVFFPAGKLSFADVVVEQIDGESMPPVNGGPLDIVLGEPNYDIEQGKGFFTLGCGGSITVRFSDNALVDIDGPDLYIFELGSIIEATMLEISKDGKEWLVVGEINGGRAEVDIHDHVKEGDVFNYVRLTDLKSGCEGYFSGADIDAIAAIGSVAQVNLSGSVLFESGSYALKSSALTELNKLADDLNASSLKSIEVYGHTDNVGSDQSNQTLSLNRANAVKNHLKSKMKDKSVQFVTKGFGESQPIADNETEDGKQKNRRVSIVVHPKEVEKIDKSAFEELSNIIFLKCRIDSQKWYNGYPQAVNEKNFSWMDQKHIDDILYYNNYSYFFSGSSIKVFNHKTSQPEDIEAEIGDLFGGITFNRIDAAFYMPNDDKICFCKDDSCYVFNPQTKKAKFYLLEDLFPGLTTKKPECVMYLGEDLYFFFFNGYMQLYDNSVKQPYRKAETINETSKFYPLLVGSPLWLDGPDAIWDDFSGIAYFFRNPD